MLFIFTAIHIFFWENADADTILKHLLTFREENNLNMEKHADFNVW